MPWKVSDVMDQRIRFVTLALRGGESMTALCKEFGIARVTGYKWLNRYREAGSFTGLGDRSRRPRRSPTRTAPEAEARALALRDRYGWGARKLQALLEAEGTPLSERTVHRILERGGRLHPRDRRRPAPVRFERQAPNELWQMDFKGWLRAGAGQCHPLSVLDDHSRYAVGLYALKSTGLEGVSRSLEEAFSRCGVPEAMLMDHGTPWWSTTNGHGLTRLGVKLIRQGVRLLWSGIGHPQTQGKVERFHGTLARAVRHRGRPRSWDQWQPLFDQLRHEYNRIRPHEGIQMQIPADRYRPSRRRFNPRPPRWDYPSGLRVLRLNSQGCLDWAGRRYFVCEALSSQRVAAEEVDAKVLIRFRHMYVREIDLRARRTRPLVAFADGRKAAVAATAPPKGAAQGEEEAGAPAPASS